MFNTDLLPQLIEKTLESINENAAAITALDQEIGDGDHVVNLQRGLNALFAERETFAQQDWATAYKKIGMILMSKVGGASGSLFATLFLAMSKQAENGESFAQSYAAGVEAMKLRGKSQAGEKTMLDVLIPVAEYLDSAMAENVALTEIFKTVKVIAIEGMESTRDMVATKGRASFLEQRSLGVIDAGASSCQIMICAIADALLQALPA